MQTITLDTIKSNGWLVLEVITGSRAYGLATAGSDTDIRGVFVLPRHLYYGFHYTAQVNNDTNDIVYYELGRFMELLSKNNPNIMELLNTLADCILYYHPIMDFLQPGLFLSKLCEQTFANYAFTQIKKAYGLEKKILNPVDKERKSVLDFCYVLRNKSSILLQTFLAGHQWQVEELGLSAIPHMKDCYHLFYSADKIYSGIIRKENANDVATSNIPKEAIPVGMLYFNKDGYSTYCKKYKAYWDWVAKRNEERYKGTLSHGKNYDAKNMMHVFRLLRMAKEIATEQQIHVRRNDRDFLLDIKAGQFEYDELVQQAEVLKDELPTLFQQSGLPDAPDIDSINNLLVEMRTRFYS